MQEEKKHQIREAAIRYMADKNINASDLAGITSVNASYLSNILNGVYTYSAPGGKDAPISQKHFVKIAEAVGVEVQRIYWKNNIKTMQFLEMIGGMEQCKWTCKTGTLICPTGMGKTNAVNIFCKDHPKHTYLITVNSLIKVHDVLNELADALKLELSRGKSKAGKFIAIVTALRDIKRAGGYPIIIFDEMENAELPMIKFVKGLFDGMKHGDTKYGAIVQVGTKQLLEKMLRLKSSTKESGPQYYRRFKASVNEISTKLSFEPFYEALNIQDKGLRKLLGNICENYGELNDYLEPALRKADEREVELNEEFFRVMYNMPNAA